MYKPDYYPNTTPPLIEIPAKDPVENRFNELVLPDAATFGEALELIAIKYRASRKDLCGIVAKLAAKAPGLAASFGSVIQSIEDADASVFLEDILKRYPWELDKIESWAIENGVRAYDEEISAIFSSLEERVRLSMKNDLGKVMQDRMKGKVEEWGILSHPQLDIKIVITSAVTGSISSRTKYIEGLYHLHEESGNSIRFSVDKVEKILPHPAFEWAGRARLYAEGQTLDFFMPGLHEGDIPNRGVLRPLANNNMAIPLGYSAVQD